MKLDDWICYCYHVPLRKLLLFARREKPLRASQMSQCLGAGTGCGWCIPILKKIHAESTAEATFEEGQSVPGLPETAEEYAQARRRYLASGDEKNQF
ncbi:MAG: (2Fe-2S)-binding protein [Phycisphaerae bacterium]|nr:(2Fe-2S)-binding protein [Phycisphaerae bacterium]